MMDLLKDYGFVNCKPATMPMAYDFRLIIKLLYLTIMILDIANLVQQLSQFLDCPTEDHMTTTHRALSYIKDTIGEGLFYSSTLDGNV